MKAVKLNSQRSLKNINWKLFFNMRMFRYAFLKQLKSISTYVFLLSAIISGGFILLLTFVSKKLCSSINELNINCLKQEVNTIVKFYKSYFFIFFMIIFTFFITFKSLQIFHDEMDNGTLLIFSSMPYSRLKLTIQKWLSLQTTCLIFILNAIFISYIMFLLTQGFSTPSWEVAKVLYKNSLSLIIGSVIFQIFMSVFIILISLYFDKIATIGFSGLFSGISIAMFFVPAIIELHLLKGSASEMNEKTKTLSKESNQNNLLQYYKDPDLKELFEIENWYIDNEWDKHNHEQFELTFEPEIITELHDVLSNLEKANSQSKQQTFLTKKIKVKIVPSSLMPKAVKEIFNLFNKTTTKDINLCPVRFNTVRYLFSTSYEINKDDQKLIKSKNSYKTALDNINNFNQKENKIVQLSKSLFEKIDPISNYSIEFVQFDQDTQIFTKCLAKEYEKKYPPTNDNDRDNVERKINQLLSDITTSKKIAYFIDNSAFQNLSFLIKNLFQEIIINMYQLDSTNKVIMNDKKMLEKYLKFIKANNYLNIMTQIAFIWDGPINSLQSSHLRNYYGEWEKKESTFTKQDGTSTKIEYLKIKPESLKKNY